MPLTKRELAVLRAIKKERIRDSRWARVHWMILTFSVLLVLFLLGAMVSYQLDWPLVLLLNGIGVGAAVAYIRYFRVGLRLRPLWLRIIAWDEVDHLLAEADEELPVPTLEVARTDVRVAPDATGIQPARATEIQQPDRA